MEKHLHIVCLDVPYPVDYGGVFDLFYKIKSLSEHGVKIHLHCFEYGRGEQTELEKYCVEVIYYPRNKGHKGFSTEIPYIVASRSSKSVADNLNKDNYPVVLEGIHCTYPLFAGQLKKKKVYVRLHNVEHTYYRHLCRHENSLLKKIYFFRESRLLKRYEASIANKASFITVSEKDMLSYKEYFHSRNISYLPVFTPFQEVHSEEGSGNYCLYHGNLSVAENEKAAIWLLEKVFARMDIPFIIAGRNPSARLQRIAEVSANTCLIANPDEQEIGDLIARAHINVLPSFNETGIKLKLLHALFKGRHCVVNDQAVRDSAIGAACHVANTPDEITAVIRNLFTDPFQSEDIRFRKKLLTGHYNNDRNAEQLIALIW
ncbi:MAG: glycosyltransferase [Chitinophagaceae bacterium]